jgi:hypothetical protein
MRLHSSTAFVGPTALTGAARKNAMLRAHKPLAVQQQAGFNETSKELLA